MQLARFIPDIKLPVHFKPSRRVIGIFITLTLLVLVILLTHITGIHYKDVSLTGDVSSDKNPHEATAAEETSSNPPDISPSFENDGYFHDTTENNRYYANDAWRPNDAYRGTFPGVQRPAMPPASKYENMGHYLKQPLVADYAEGAEKIFLMIKTGSTVLWDRLPVHLFTTLTRVPNFALYADTASSIGGYEVIDILANVTDESYNSDSFDMYRKLRTLHDSHGVIDGSETDLSGGWNLDKFKNIPMLAHAYNQSPQSDWFVFMDADSYFFLDTLINWLSTLDPNQPLYLGSAASLGRLMFAHGGSGVVLSRKALELTVGQHPEYVQEYEKKTFDYCCGDFMVALMLKEKLNVEISRGYGYPHVGWKFQGRGPHGVHVTKDCWCDEIVSFHKMPASAVEHLWEYERLKGPQGRKQIRYADFYKDWYLPYINDRREGWDNGADTRSFSKYKDEEIVKLAKEQGKDDAMITGSRPWHSYEECKKSCDEWKFCLMFKYSPGSNSCNLADFVILGRPDYDFEKGVPGQTISGWNTDHIRKLRRSRKCDVLHGTKDDKSYNTLGEDRTEGWYIRQQEEERLRLKVDGNSTIT